MKRLYVVVAISCGIAGFALRETFAEPSSEQVILDRLFEQTSNAWCVAKQDFDTASSTNMLALRMLGTIESEAARGEWISSMLRWQVSTNDIRAYRVWMNAKSFWLSGCARRFLDPSHTNVWLSAADLLGELRSEMVDVDELQHSAVRRIWQEVSNSNDMGRVVIATGAPEWLLRAVDHQNDVRACSSVVSEAVIEQFGRKGIPKMAQESRLGFFSNFVERARLRQDEVETIRSAIVDAAGGE